MGMDDVAAKFTEAEKILGYCFKKADLLREALTHRSWSNEYRAGKLPDNDRLEYLGDSVLDLVVAHLLFTRHPTFSSGEMTKVRAALVNETELAAITRENKLGACLLLGIGEERTGGADKASNLAHLYEALLGALYLDGGLEAAWPVIARDMEPRVEAHARAVGQEDYKSQLQEICAKRHWGLPQYRLIGRQGPDHESSFTVQCFVGKSAYGTGEGRNIKAAEQHAAQLTLGMLAVQQEQEADE